MDEPIQTSVRRSVAADESARVTAGSSSASPVKRASPRAARTEAGQIEDDSPHQVAALTRAMARGDEAAFREFYDVYFDRLLRYLLVVTGGDELATREALQLTLVRVVRHVKPFDDEEKFWSWLTVLARSARADEARKQRRYFAFLEKFTRHADMENSAGDNGAAEEQLRELLEKSLSSLPAEERELIAQKYFLRRSVRDIADRQHATEKAVESKLSRIRRKLKEAVFARLKNERTP